MSILSRLRGTPPSPPGQSEAVQTHPQSEENPPIAVEVQDLAKNFGRRAVLRSVSFVVRQGETVGLVGPQAAGKTTLLNLMLGYFTPSRGQVTLFPQHDRQARPPTLGYLPQRLRFPRTLTPWTFLGYCACFSGLPRGERDDRIAEVLSAVGLSGMSRRPIVHLSPFEQRLVGLAQAVLAHPSLLALDAPMEGLAVEEAQAMLALICLLKEEQQTLLMTGRSMQDIGPLCQRMLLLGEGVTTEVPSGSARAAGMRLGGRLRVTLDIAPPALMERLRGLSCRFEGGESTFVLHGGSSSQEQEVLMHVLQAGCRIVEMRRTEGSEGEA